MTATIEPTAPPRSTPPSGPHTGSVDQLRRRRIRWAIAIAIVLAVVVAAWLTAAAVGRSGVQILAADAPLLCTPSSAATTTDAQIGSGVDTVRVPAIRVSGPLHCELTYIVANGGPLPVTLDAVHFTAGSFNGGTRVGTVDVGARSIGPGDSTAIHIPLTWAKGCQPDGGTATSSGPDFVVSALGASGTVTRFGPALTVLGTAQSETTCSWRTK